MIFRKPIERDVKNLARRVKAPGGGVVRSASAPEER